MKHKIWNYINKNYKPLMLVPLLMLLLSIGVLAYNHQTTGEWFKRSVDLRGGTQITFSVGGDVDVPALQRALEDRFGDATVRELGGVGEKGLLVAVGDVEPRAVVGVVEQHATVKDFSTQQIGPALGETFWRQSQTAFIFAFFFMAIVVFLSFRTFVPSLAVIQAAVTDILGTLAVMQLLGIELSLASFAGLMAIIGYSVGTDILLTARMLRGGMNPTEGLASAVKTGLTMTLTALIALVAIYATATSSVLSDIAAVLAIALVVDLPATYLMNAGLIRLYLERGGRT